MSGDNKTLQLSQALLNDDDSDDEEVTSVSRNNNPVAQSVQQVQQTLQQQPQIQAWQNIQKQQQLQQLPQQPVQQQQQQQFQQNQQQQMQPQQQFQQQHSTAQHLQQPQRQPPSVPIQAARLPNSPPQQFQPQSSGQSLQPSQQQQPSQRQLPQQQQSVPQQQQQSQNMVGGHSSVTTDEEAREKKKQQGVEQAFLIKALVRKLFEKTSQNNEMNSRLKEMMKEMQRDRQNGQISSVPKELLLRAEKIVGKVLLKEALSEVQAMRKNNSMSGPPPMTQMQLEEKAEQSIQNKDTIHNHLDPITKESGKASNSAYKQAIESASTLREDIVNDHQERAHLVASHAKPRYYKNSDPTLDANKNAFNRKECAGLLKQITQSINESNFSVHGQSSSSSSNHLKTTSIQIPGIDDEYIPNQTPEKSDVCYMISRALQFHLKNVIGSVHRISRQRHNSVAFQCGNFVEWSENTKYEIENDIKSCGVILNPNLLEDDEDDQESPQVQVQVQENHDLLDTTMENKKKQKTMIELELEIKNEIFESEQDYEKLLKAYKRDSKKFTSIPIHWLISEEESVRNGELDLIQVAKHYMKRRICKENKLGPFKHYNGGIQQHSSLTSSNGVGNGIGVLKRNRDEDNNHDNHGLVKSSNLISQENDLKRPRNSPNSLNPTTTINNHHNPNLICSQNEEQQEMKNGRDSPSGQYGHHPIHSTQLSRSYYINATDVMRYLESQLPPFTCPAIQQKGRVNSGMMVNRR